MACFQHTKASKPGQNSTSGSKRSKCCVPTGEESIWVKNLAHTSHHKVQCGNLPSTTHQNTMGYPSALTGRSWNGRMPYYTQVSFLKIFGERLLVMLFG